VRLFLGGHLKMRVDLTVVVDHFKAVEMEQTSERPVAWLSIVISARGGCSGETADARKGQVLGYVVECSAGTCRNEIARILKGAAHWALEGHEFAGLILGFDQGNELGDG